MNLETLFNTKSIAVVGVSDNPHKVGSVIFNTLNKYFKGKVYAISKHKELYGVKCYSSLSKLQIKPKVVVIAVPNEIALKILEEMGRLKIKQCILVTAGFKEIGDMKAEKRLHNLLEKYKILTIGPNCLGVLNTENNLDTLFLPPERLERPKKGNIGFISQSGAIGSAVIDLAASQGFGFSKFISYGNANNVDESDLLEYLGKDKQTHVICLYLEGVKDGKKFIETVKKIKKPIIAIKGGVTESGSKATLSHTGSLAGNAKIYEGIFKQVNILQAQSLEEVFDYAKIFSFIKTKTRGKRVQVITNGGGYGILAVDAIEIFNLETANLENKSIKYLKKKFPKLVTISNPMDLVGDSNNERYRIALESCVKDKNNDMILLIILSQTPLIDLKLVPIVKKIKKETNKPIIAVTTGGAYSHELKKELEKNKIPCYDFPHNAVRAMKELVDYSFGD